MSKAKETCKKYGYNPAVVDGIIDALEEKVLEYDRKMADLMKAIQAQAVKEAGNVQKPTEVAQDARREPSSNIKEEVKEMEDK